MKYRLIPMLSIVAVAFSICACGSSSSDGGSSGGPSDGQLVRDDVLEPTRSLVMSVASSLPRAGSIIQGSSVNSEGVTSDRVSVNRTGNTISGVTINDNIRMNRCEPDDTTEDTVPVENPSQFCFSDDGNALAAIFSDFIDITGTSSDEFIPIFRGNDPLVFGFWCYFNSGDEIIWGMLTDGFNAQETPASSIPSSRTCYSGRVAGVLYDDDDLALLAGTVDLIFEADGTIRGRLTGGSGEEDTDDTTISLEQTGSRDNNGLYRGKVSFPILPPGVTGNPMGNWGAQFFGDNANQIGGTFGLGTTDSDPVTFVGVFSAEKQQDCL